ncbi:LLM class flavin-dependent oxidoreductase [Halopseudomonas aestusnigri]|uniref:Luciferase-like monooxygenase n=1 Tax=Halopseudomonas aestusnigri TaxID=857252 RepID=A0AAQ1JNY6_9GAMM|nr:LLM class flavin-dependent oxidoreductase [Halopseudomonas aestusnigri]OWL91232.1 luciferase family oxidoreductase [Halopseudomonas aestusnigri]SEF63791.1 luciferase family oxidoreductase, group 1 [Halopseudomonas aestusnigri]
MPNSTIPLSVLDLCSIAEEGTAADALHNAQAMARHCEALGYQRYWVAEHHNMTGIASAATSVVMGYLAGSTQRIRIGSGGIMLPNHAPLQIAEQFGTLESLYPGRIDLGLGRAPGTDPATANALRRGRTDGEDFPQMLEELRRLFAPIEPGQRLRAVPGGGLNIPIWLLGSSTFSAQLAGRLGLPFAFAGQFSPDYLFSALRLYRESFRPSDQYSEPYAMLGINAYVADDREQAHYLASSHQQAFLNLIRGTPGQLPPPTRDMESLWQPHERHQVMSTLAGSLIGDLQSVTGQLSDLLERTGANELIVNSPIFDQNARKHSYQLLMQASQQR